MLKLRFRCGTHMQHELVQCSKQRLNPFRTNWYKTIYHYHIKHNLQQFCLMLLYSLLYLICQRVNKANIKLGQRCQVGQNPVSPRSSKELWHLNPQNEALSPNDAVILAMLVLMNTKGKEYKYNRKKTKTFHYLKKPSSQRLGVSTYLTSRLKHIWCRSFTNTAKGGDQVYTPPPLHCVYLNASSPTVWLYLARQGATSCVGCLLMDSCSSRGPSGDGSPFTFDPCVAYNRSVHCAPLLLRSGAFRYGVHRLALPDAVTLLGGDAF